LQREGPPGFEKQHNPNLYVITPIQEAQDLLQDGKFIDFKAMVDGGRIAIDALNDAQETFLHYCSR